MGQTAESSANHIMMESTTDHSDPETTPEVPAAVDAACEWLEINEDATGPADIFTIIRRCLIDAKKLKCGCTMKMMTQLTAVSEYMKLQDHYQAHGRTKMPCLKASLAIAYQMGKGSYFTCQICQNEAYLLHHQ